MVESVVFVDFLIEWLGVALEISFVDEWRTVEECLEGEPESCETVTECTETAAFVECKILFEEE
jgi:hypothetical protein